MRLEVTTKHEYKKSNFGKWNLIEESKEVFEGNEKIDSFLKRFFQLEYEYVWRKGKNNKKLYLL